MSIEPLVIRPDRFRQFGPPDGCAFCLVTNAALMQHFQIEETPTYSRTLTIPFDEGDSFERLLTTGVIPEPAHVLIVSPLAFFQSPPPPTIGRRKLMAMACNSTPTPFEALRYFLDVVERTDPDAQQRFADRFFALGEASERLQFTDETIGVSASGSHATFNHLSDHYEWNQQAGPLDWGAQQLAPAGEISVLPIEILRFDAALRLPIDGEVAFRGYPVLHSGTPSYLREDQARIHGRLATLADHAVVASVQRGVITGLRATHPDAMPAVQMLEAMFEVDSRYRIIWEIGFGINTALTAVLPGNHAMNEVFGGSGHGALHYGIGLTPFTQYHLDIICPSTRVTGVGGQLLLGAQSAGRSEVALASH